MENQKDAGNKKKLMIFAGAIIVIILIVVAVALQFKRGANQGSNTNVSSENGNQPTTETSTTTPKESTPPIPVSNVLKDTRVEAPNANPITKDNRVITQDGKQTMNNVSQTSPLAPSETGPVKKEQLSSSAIKLDVSAAGFSPKEFTVKSGAPVTVSITSVDDFVHSFVFEDPSLSAIGIGVYSKETRAATFNAPAKAGEYVFFCNVGSHRSRGEAGKMIVK